MSITTLITLPCTAQELENALHAVCDHHGAWDAEIGLAMNGPQPPRLTLSCAPSVTAANENKTTNTKGETQQ